MVTLDLLQKLRKIPNSLYVDLKVEFLFHSNKLEGSTFSTEQLAYLEDKGIVDGTHKLMDVVETSNSLKLFEVVMDTATEEITDDLILYYHGILKKGTVDEDAGLVGVWKLYANKIVGSPVKLAQPYEVREKIANLLEQWKSGGRKFTDIAHFHVEFEKIHPFQDGNGRVGRFLILKQCLSEGIPLIVIDSEFEQEYKKALATAQTGQGFEDFYKVLRKCQERFANKDIVRDTLESIRRMELF